MAGTSSSSRTRAPPRDESTSKYSAGTSVTCIGARLRAASRNRLVPAAPAPSAAARPWLATWRSAPASITCTAASGAPRKRDSQPMPFSAIDSRRWSPCSRSERPIWPMRSHAEIDWARCARADITAATKISTSSSVRPPSVTTYDESAAACHSAWRSSSRSRSRATIEATSVRACVITSRPAPERTSASAASDCPARCSATVRASSSRLASTRCASCSTSRVRRTSPAASARSSAIRAGMSPSAFVSGSR